MQEPNQSPIRATDDEARALARSLIDTATYGALGVHDPETDAPIVSRVATGANKDGIPVTLISDLSRHTQALKVDPVCSLLVGEPEPRGDPLTHPRVTLQAVAEFVARGTSEHDELRVLWLKQHPKSKLYVDFADFGFVRFKVTKAYLNGGFGRAYVLAPQDFAQD